MNTRTATLAILLLFGLGGCDDAPVGAGRRPCVEDADCPADERCRGGFCEPGPRPDVLPRDTVQPDAPCVPVCEGRACGPDGCGGVCGTCDAPEVCDEDSGTCVTPTCEPDCEGLDCGLDPLCGEPCGACEDGHDCVAGQCVDPDTVCHDVPFAGCCLNNVVHWCQEGKLEKIDCAENPSCGWDEDSEIYDCAMDGAASPNPELPLLCCQITATCEELGRQCGFHPDCPILRCGTCEPGKRCGEQGTCE